MGSSGQNSNTRIAIVDDKLKNIQFIGTLLRDKGYLVSVAQNGEQALEIIRQEPPDIILLDIVMPVMDGMETCRRLKENSETRDIPVIFLSALTDTVDKVRCFEMGAVDFLSKPIETAELMARIDTHLTKRFLQKKLEKLNVELEEKVQIRTRELVEARKMEATGALAGGIAHDFNNVLGGILAILSVMEHKLKKNGEIGKEKLAHYIDSMQEASLSAADVVQQLLSISRKQVLNFAPVDLNLIIARITKICSSTFDKSIKLKSTVHDGPANVIADPSQLEQVVLNLCVNACHAMTIMKQEKEPWGGELTVSLELVNMHDSKPIDPGMKREDYWKITISDTGVGMESEVIDNIFTPYYTTKEKGKGSGLGLSTVYNVVDLHHGFMRVQSEINKGTSFDVCLPVSNTLVLEKDEDQRTDIEMGSGMILVVDDEKIIQGAASEILIACGYDVLTADNGVEAVKIFEKQFNQIKAVLLDMVMPEMSGQEAYRKMKEIKSDVKILLSSGFKADKRIGELLKNDNTKYLNKPYTFDDLAKAVSLLLKE